MASFGSTYVLEPRPGQRHTHTAILLHGRGSNGTEFAGELFDTTLSNHQLQSVTDRLPTWRWIFPSSPSTWAATFEEWMPAWFEAHSLADPRARQDLQQPGLRSSVAHVTAVIEQEVQVLQAAAGPGDAYARIVLGGISLGGAVALWSLLGTQHPERPFGGFVALSAWLPFATEISQYLRNADGSSPTEEEPLSSAAFVHSMMAPVRQHLGRQQHTKTTSVLSTPVFIGHGRDDAYVDVTLGQQTRQLLEVIGFTSVQWREYEGAEQEGHWIKEPEEMDDLVLFLESISAV